jgi:hypothetical protein
MGYNGNVRLQTTGNGDVRLGDMGVCTCVEVAKREMSNKRIQTM